MVWLALALLMCGCGGNVDGEGFDAAELERQEDLSEALANDLLKLSVATRERDYVKIEQFFADSLVVWDEPVPSFAKVKYQGRCKCLLHLVNKS